MFDVMKAVTKRKGDGEKRTEWNVWKCIWYLEDGWWIRMILKSWEMARWCRLLVNVQGGMGKRGKEEEERE